MCLETECITQCEQVNIGKNRTMTLTTVRGWTWMRCHQNWRIKYIKLREIPWIIKKSFVLICGKDSGKRDELWDNLSLWKVEVSGFFVISSMRVGHKVSKSLTMGGTTRIINHLSIFILCIPISFLTNRLHASIISFLCKALPSTN